MEKQRRTIYRAQVTKLSNEVDCVLAVSSSHGPASLEQLTILFDRLSIACDNLKQANVAMEPLLQPETFEAEFATVIEYEDTAITALAKLKCAMQALQESSTTSVGSSTSLSRESDATRSTIKLPKLDLNRFNGELVKWHPFWEQFKSAIHENPRLTVSDKFHYLRSLTTGSAAAAIAGLQTTEACYNDAIETLKSRFGNTGLIVQDHIRKLLALHPVSSITDVKGLRRLHDFVHTHIRGLTGLGVSSDSYCSMLYPVLLQALPTELAVDYHRKYGTFSIQGNGDVIETHSTTGSSSSTGSSIQQSASLDSLLNFLRTEVQCREICVPLTTQGKDSNQKKPFKKGKPVVFSKHGASATALTTSTSQVCFLCDSAEHGTEQCSADMSIQERKDKLKTARRCFKCTLANHTSRNCKRKISCGKCNGRHATSMCEPRVANNTTDAQVVTTVAGLHTALPPQRPLALLLQTATVWAEGDQRRRLVRCLFDGGSQRTFIRQGVADELGLVAVGEEAVAISAFGNTKELKSQKCRRIEVWLRSQYDRSMRRLEALEVPEICGQPHLLPTEIAVKLQSHKFQLADTVLEGNELPKCTIEILIGADYYWTIVSNEIKRISDALVAVNTKFGWTLQGPAPLAKDPITSICTIGVMHSHVVSDVVEEHADQLLESFWDLEHLGIKEAEKASSYQDPIYKNFSKDVYKQDGRYGVKLPWKERAGLNDNYGVAKTRLDRLVKQLKKSDEVLIGYDKAIRSYLEDGFAERVLEKSGPCYYMPHRGVVRNDKSTSKLRIVFDASSHAVGATSLNDHLHTGPNMNPELVQVLIRFRAYKIALSADVEKAFLQIAVHREDQDVLRFLWFSEPLVPDQPLPVLETWRMTRVPFGVTCSPFLLAATIRHHLQEVKTEYPNVAEKLENSLYVDDLLTGADEYEEAQQLHIDATNIMQRAGMTLRKWCSNDSKLQQQFQHQQDNPDNNSKLMPTSSLLKVLGLAWSPAADLFTFEVTALIQYIDEIPVTKRSVLKASARLYDPLGFLNPYSIKARALFQVIWERKLAWDDALPADLEGQWLLWSQGLNDLSDIKIPRFIGGDKPIANAELHVFTDASPTAYGAAVYMRVGEGTEVSVSLLMSKARVAPLKKQSIPRLELIGALVGARLANYAKKTLNNFNISAQYLWTDSQITLCWIKGESKERKIFIANRVNEIQRLTSSTDWYYCPGTLNPADLLTRGISAKELSVNEVWWKGPRFLWLATEEWPEQPLTVSFPKEEVEEAEVLHTTIAESQSVFPLENYSRITCLYRVTAWILRFTHNLKNKEQARKGCLSAEELKIAQNYWLRYVQSMYFTKEVRDLKAGKKLNNESSILQLNPYLDEEGIIRVGGRLQHCQLDGLPVHPVILPSDGHLTQLLIQSAHQEVLHGGVRDTLVQIRSKYWICKARQSVKRSLRKCLTCQRLTRKPIEPPTAVLPADRINRSEAFEVVGVDFAGPLYLKGTEGSCKSYIALFTCAVTRALHLELVHDLSARAFLMAFRRFTARRGLCCTVYSDNALTFKRASKDLKELWSAMRHEDIQAHFAKHCIKWKFIVEGAPWWGGFYERMVRTVKMSLKKTLGTSSLTFEEMTTILAEVEAVVNSRPLTYVDDNPHEPEPLTPSHFLIGKRLTSLPPSRERDSNTSTVKELQRRWKYRQRVIDAFWNRWTMEYLGQLRSAHCISHKEPWGLKINDIVLVKQPNQPRLLWKMARITQIFPGRDGVIRSCAFQLPNGTVLKRPVQQIYPLEMIQ